MPVTPTISSSPLTIFWIWSSSSSFRSRSGNATFSPTLRRIEERAALKDHRDLLAHRSHLLIAEAGDVLAGNQNPSPLRLQKAHDLLQRHRLAHSGAAKDAQRLSRQHLEAHIVQHMQIAKRFRDVIEDDIWHRWRGRRLRSTAVLLPLADLVAEELGR